MSSSRQLNPIEFIGMSDQVVALTCYIDLYRTKKRPIGLLLKDPGEDQLDKETF